MFRFLLRSFRRYILKIPTGRDPEIEGLWRRENEFSDGREQPSYYYFHDGVHKEIVPNDVDDGTLRSSYATDVSTIPRRFFVRHDYNGPDGPPDPNPIIERGVYEIDGDTLRITYGLENEFPKSLTDVFPYSIKTLIRDTGPVPEAKKPSGTPPITDKILGQLNWHDNLSWYEGVLQIGKKSVSIAICPDDGDGTKHVLPRAISIVGNIDHYVRLIQEYAVNDLLSLKNDTWLHGGQRPVSREQFIKSMNLESITIYPDGHVDFLHDDGGLFFGHAIEVSIDPTDRCLSTDIPG